MPEWFHRRQPGGGDVRSTPRLPAGGERLASLVLLAVLPIVAVAVYQAGRRIDPDLLPPASITAPASTPVPAAAGPGIDGALRTFVSAMVEPGWAIDGAPTAFDASRLYEKIDGRADLYLRHGARRLVALSLANEDRFIDVFAYEMVDAASAGRLLDEERPAGARDLATGRQGYTAAGSVFLTVQCYYVQLVASEATDEIGRAAGALADRLAHLLESSRCR